MKVLYLVPDDAFFWSHRRALAAAVLEAGCEVVVATPDGPCRDRIEAEGFTFRAVPMPRSLRPLDLARTVRAIVALYRAEQPDLVHHISMRAILGGGLAARITRVPAVVNLVTGLGWVFSSGPRLLRWMVRLAYRLCLDDRASWTVFQNPDDRDEFVAQRLVSAERSSVILGSGVDPRRFRPEPEPEGTPSVLLAARMLQAKGVADLVEAGRLLRADGIEHRIVLAGRPDERNPGSIPAGQLEAWNDEGVVHYVGHCEDVASLLGDCHVACLPSYYREGVPKFLLEAMAAGRPIVTTDTPGCRELVPAGATSGRLVAPRSPREIANALGELLSDSESRRRMGRTARELAEERFTEDAVIEQTFGVYSAVTGAEWQ
ncbi:MAG: glycosyltransferase family 4 protein [Planctomycetota bacterium]